MVNREEDGGGRKGLEAIWFSNGEQRGGWRGIARDWRLYGYVMGKREMRMEGVERDWRLHDGLCTVMVKREEDGGGQRGTGGYTVYGYVMVKREEDAGEQRGTEGYMVM